jgi:hypothetical protein
MNSRHGLITVIGKLTGPRLSVHPG